VALMSVWSKRITADAAFWGIVSGFVFNALPKALEYLGWVELPFWLDPILLGGLVSLVVVLVLAGPVVVQPTTWIAWRMIRKSYG
jgi:sodium/pantothenate symporter